MNDQSRIKLCLSVISLNNSFCFSPLQCAMKSIKGLWTVRTEESVNCHIASGASVHQDFLERNVNTETDSFNY